MARVSMLFAIYAINTTINNERNIRNLSPIPRCIILCKYTERNFEDKEELNKK